MLYTSFKVNYHHRRITPCSPEHLKHDFVCGLGFALEQSIGKRQESPITMSLNHIQLFEEVRCNSKSTVHAPSVTRGETLQVGLCGEYDDTFLSIWAVVVREEVGRVFTSGLAPLISNGQLL